MRDVWVTVRFSNSDTRGGPFGTLPEVCNSSFGWQPLHLVACLEVLPPVISTFPILRNWLGTSCTKLSFLIVARPIIHSLFNYTINQSIKQNKTNKQTNKQTIKKKMSLNALSHFMHRCIFTVFVVFYIHITIAICIIISRGDKIVAGKDYNNITSTVNSNQSFVM